MDLDKLEVKQNYVPKGWSLVPFSVTVEKIPLTGKKLKQSDYLQSGKLPVIDQGQEFIGGYTNREEFKVSEKPILIFGDHTKIVKYINFDFVAGADGVKVIKPLSCFYPKLLYYFLKTIDLPEKGYHRHFQFLEKSVIPLPPLPEQQRIVAKIEELFTKLDAGIEALKEIKSQLKRYRQAVLKYAFEGKLTEEWRQSELRNPNSTLRKEPASVLLERIKAERKKRHGKKYKELPSLDMMELPQLPESWAWTLIGSISDVTKLAGFEFTKYFKYKDSGAVKVVRGINVGFGNFKPENFHYIDKEISDMLPRSQLHGGELLIAYVGSLGTAAILPKDGNRYHLGPNVGKITIDDTIGDARFLLLYLLSSSGQELIMKTSKAVTQSSLSMQTIRQMIVPLASIVEQNKIVEEVERRFSVADEIEKVVDSSLKQSERLRQSILKRAFEGKLVNQDPTDEPAEKLLERIKAEKAKRLDDINKSRKTRLPRPLKRARNDRKTEVK